MPTCCGHWRPTVYMTSTERTKVFGLDIAALDLQGVVEHIDRRVRARTPMHHLSVNAAKLVRLRNDHELRAIATEADLITADGQAVVWAARLLGRPLPGRVAGIDVMLEIIELSSRSGYRTFFLGATDDVLRGATANLKRRWPELIVAGARNGYFRPTEVEAVIGEVHNAAPDVVFVAMPTPLKERWAREYLRRGGRGVVIGVGGAFDVVAGVTRRAPRVIQRAGLEWMFRMMQEPRRLFWRYATTNTIFIATVAREVARRRFLDPLRRRTT